MGYWILAKGGHGADTAYWPLGFEKVFQATLACVTTLSLISL